MAYCIFHHGTLDKVCTGFNSNKMRSWHEDKLYHGHFCVFFVLAKMELNATFLQFSGFDSFNCVLFKNFYAFHHLKAKIDVN